MATSSRQQSIDQMLESIASMEHGLANIISGEAGKIKAAIEAHKNTRESSLDNLLNVNKSVESMMRKVIMKEMLLNFQLEDVVGLDNNGGDPAPPEYPEDIRMMCFASVIPVGDTVCYTPTIYPSNALNQTLTWHSSDTAVATVEGNGCVTALSPGTTTITVITANNLATKCEFTVGTLPESLELDPVDFMIEIDSTETITAIVRPDSAINTITWSSDNPSIASVTPDGTVRGEGLGSTTIRATTINGIVATASVTVLDHTP